MAVVGNLIWPKTTRPLANWSSQKSGIWHVIQGNPEIILENAQPEEYEVGQFRADGAGEMATGPAVTQPGFQRAGPTSLSHLG